MLMINITNLVKQESAGESDLYVPFVCSFQSRYSFDYALGSSRASSIASFSLVVRVGAGGTLGQLDAAAGACV